MRGSGRPRGVVGRPRESLDVLPVAADVQTSGVGTSRTSRFWTSRTPGSGRPGQLLAVQNPRVWASRVSDAWTSSTSSLGRPEPGVLDVQSPQVMDVQNPRFWPSSISFWPSRTPISGRPRSLTRGRPELQLLDIQILGYWTSRICRSWTSTTAGSGRPGPQVLDIQIL